MTTAAEVIATARSKLGARYVFGDEGPDTFDCSGLMQWAFGQHGIRLPRVAADQAKYGQTVAWEAKQPGDLIFTTWDGSPDVDHVALYLGDNQYLHAPRTGDVVKVSTISSGYRQHVTNVQRVPALGGGTSSGGNSQPGIPPILGGAIGATGSGIVDSVAGLADAARTIATGAVSVGNLAAQLGKLALPSNAMRLAAGGFGVAFLFAGILIIGRQVRE